MPYGHNSARRNRKLFSCTRQDLVLPSFVDPNGVVHSRDAGGVPVFRWPDGRWCHSANRFILEKYYQGLSRSQSGGTLATIAAHISHLIRFCWERRIDFHQLTDNDFSSFIDQLSTEKAAGAHSEVSLRNANTVIAIGRDCLGLLLSEGVHIGDNSLVAPDGRIIVSVSNTRIWRRTRVEGKAHGFTHTSFPQPCCKKKRLPISDTAAEAMWHAVRRISGSPQQRMRRYVLLKLLEITGGRRGEIAELQVSSIIEACRMPEPVLKLTTLKKRSSTPYYRYVPVSRADIDFLSEYIEVFRSPVLRRSWAGRDHGIAMVNIRSGAPLKAGSITAEVKRIAKEAGISEHVGPHRFRHRYITKQLIALLEAHQVDSVDGFRSRLLDGELIKRRLLEYTGHSSVESLEPYIHFALNEISGAHFSRSLTEATARLESFERSLAEEGHRLAGGVCATASRSRLMKLVGAVLEDLRRARSREPTAGWGDQ